MKMQDYCQFRYNMYKEYIRRNGGDMNIFNIPFIQEIIMNIIENGDPRLRFEGHSTLYFKQPNEDGSFDICGRMEGPIVNLCYKMRKVRGMLFINKYEYKQIFQTDLDTLNCPEPYITRQDMVIDLRDGSVILFEDIWKSKPNDNSLLVSLKEDGKIKSIV